MTLAILFAGCLDDRDRDLEVPAGGAIPERPMTRSVLVQAAADEDTLFLRLRFDGNRGDRDRWLCRVAGEWREEGGGFRDLQAALDGDEARGDVTRASKMTEVALTVIVDDPTSTTRLREFTQTGCFGFCHESARHMPNWRAADGLLPMEVWPGFGGFGDLWIWRAHRSGLAGFADDSRLSYAGYVPDAGLAPWTANAIGTAGLPSFVFDPATSGSVFTVPWDPAGEAEPFAFGAVDGLPAALASDIALQSGWVPADGQCVPASLLREPTGSRSNVTASSTWSIGQWDVTLARPLVTGDAAADVSFALGKRYPFALALHSDQADSRDHYASFPSALLFGTTGEGIAVVALAGTGATPSFGDESSFPATTMNLVLPGVTTWEYLVGSNVGRSGALRESDVRHGGDVEVGTVDKRCADCHTIRQGDPFPPYMDAGALERLVLRRGGVYGPTPFFGESP